MIWVTKYHCSECYTPYGTWSEAEICHNAVVQAVTTRTCEICKRDIASGTEHCNKCMGAVPPIDTYVDELANIRPWWSY